MKKIKNNFDAETVNLRINKCINANFSYWNSIYFYIRCSLHYYTEKHTLLKKQKQNILTYHYYY